MEKKGSMVDMALNVLVGSRLTSTERSMSGLDGAEPVCDESSFLNKVNLIPPLLDYQLDMAVIRLQKTLVNDIFKKMDKMIKAKKSSAAAGSWWEAFLAFFVLMQNVQFVHHTQVGFSEYILAEHYVSLLRVGAHHVLHALRTDRIVQARARDIETKSARMIEEWEVCAPNFVDVFFHYCRRHFGASPFSDGVVGTAAEKAGLQTHELDFLGDKALRINQREFAGTVTLSIGCSRLHVWLSLAHPC
jgi:hypothetical protein